MQIDRVGNPLTVEALIPLPMKDYWNRSLPANDAQFASFIGNPFFASGILNGVFGLSGAARATRLICWAIYVPDITRIDLTIAPTPLASQSRLGPLGGDNAGWPFGGRRIGDDVVDIGCRALAGILVPGFTNAPPLGRWRQFQRRSQPGCISPSTRLRMPATLHSQENGTNGRGTGHRSIGIDMRLMLLFVAAAASAFGQTGGNPSGGRLRPTTRSPRCRL